MDEKLLLSVFTAVEGAHAFSAFMPSYFTVRKFASTPSDRADLRSGYAPALIFNLALGGSLSALIKDARPLVISAIVSGGMILLYERAFVGFKGRGSTTSEET
jgi:hypothetical protein